MVTLLRRSSVTAPLMALFLSLSADVIDIRAASAQSVSEVNAQMDELFGSHKPYHAFFDKLKKAIAADDKKTVASMIDYPFKARINDKAVTIKDQKHFVEDYDKVITHKVKKAVSKQTYADLFANWQGVMIGDGEIWFSGICSDDACKQQTIRIIAIND